MLKKLGIRIFKLYCHTDYQEDILGDLDEYYEQNLKDKGSFYADSKYLIDILLLFRLSLLRNKWFYQNSINTAMINTILKTTFRMFWKERGYALLNVLGLVVGLTTGSLLLLYVESERSVNGFHTDLDQLYQILEHQTYKDGIQTTETNPGPLNTTFKDEFPEVEAMAAYTWEYELLFIHEDERHKVSGRWASEDFFSIFSVDFIEGSKENSLTSPSEVYLSKSTKERLFGEEPALSKTIEIDGYGSYQVAGVFDDVPNESTIDFDFITPYEVWAEWNNWVTEWDNHGVRGIAKLQPGVEINAFNAKIEEYVQEKLGDDEEAIASIFLQPLKDRYLYNSYENGQLSGGRITYVRLFFIVAVFILLIASINFINLATARSTKRAKEVGVKKVVGSGRGHLIVQFMTESMLLAVFSALLAGFFIMLLIDPLNHLVGKTMTFSLFNLSQALTLFAVATLVGLVSGIYPSLVLSNFKAISVLKGRFKTSSGSIGLRKGLVVFQFMISTILIIATLVVQEQLNYLKNKDLGYNKDNVVLVPIEGTLYNSDVRSQLKSKLLDNPNFVNVAYSSESTLINSGTSTASGFSWPEKKSELGTNFNLLFVEHDLLETYNIELLAGRSFDPDLATDSMHVIINEQTAKLMNVEDPVDHTVTLWGRKGRIIGIIKNFHFSSLHSGIEPLVISLRPRNSQVLNVRLSGQNTQESLSFLEESLRDVNPNYPFEYRFLDETYEAQYGSETVISTLGNYFAGVAIFISLLGLFGLASFAAEQRTKEIGVRKVLGASALSIMLEMVKGFVLLVSLGFIIAIPISYFFTEEWLGAFTYRIDIGMSIFIIAGFASLLITILTIGYHAIRAANVNPVKSLRYE